MGDIYDALAKDYGCENRKCNPHHIISPDSWPICELCGWNQNTHKPTREVPKVVPTKTAREKELEQALALVIGYRSHDGDCDIHRVGRCTCGLSEILSSVRRLLE